MPGGLDKIINKGAGLVKTKDLWINKDTRDGNLRISDSKKIGDLGISGSGSLNAYVDGSKEDHNRKLKLGTKALDLGLNYKKTKLNIGGTKSLDGTKSFRSSVSGGNNTLQGSAGYDTEKGNLGRFNGSLIYKPKGFGFRGTGNYNMDDGNASISGSASKAYKGLSVGADGNTDYNDTTKDTTWGVSSNVGYKGGLGKKSTIDAAVKYNAGSEFKNNLNAQLGLTYNIGKDNSISAGANYNTLDNNTTGNLDYARNINKNISITAGLGFNPKGYTDAVEGDTLGGAGYKLKPSINFNYRF